MMLIVFWDVMMSSTKFTEERFHLIAIDNIHRSYEQNVGKKFHKTKVQKPEKLSASYLAETVKFKQCKEK